ncbi:HAD-IIIC family phosphatase [Actinophytocola oryzae]|uniref:Methoxymalonate biosynthesis protein n=1 Tax=Actinophytocola oryzae TaxID=502181 RepID=A0A4R7VFY6_9PSEU|nr:HAD-IIIC family phosphatase [Actinophytocola oryzae]TDV47969.1 methoxymalonate biosynthesis protein [Actinophytocola oryzae]
MTDAVGVGTVKCLVWDLDNTLWQGTLLEDGEVLLPRRIRDTIVALDERGILQSVASKNDPEHAWSRLVALGVAEYFVLPRIGWQPKSASVREIADELGFAHHTIAFVDDQPAERAEVAYHLPDVRCYPAEMLPDLLTLPEFTPDTVTEDSRQRRRMYQAGVRRVAARDEFAGPDEDFLRSLRMRMEIRVASEADLARVAELTQRTSQMNATGVHYSGADLRERLADPDQEVLVTTMADRFGPHGAVGVVLLGRHPGLWHLRLLATSCRVTSFGAGSVILGWLIDQAARAGTHLVADFRRTDRNRVMEIAYRFSGFAEDVCPCETALADAPDVERLHLVPDRRPEPSTMLLSAPELCVHDSA